MPTFTCSCCHRSLPVNPRSHDQRFCGQPLCQQARKTQWQRAKLTSDPAYLQNQREACPCQTWRENHQDYWRQRRLKRSLSEATRDGPKNMASQDVNMDTLAGHANQQCFLDISKEYMIFPLPIGQGHVDGMSVNMDGLRVKFSSITAT